MKKHKVLLFYNPNAGNGLFKSNLDLIIEKFQKKKNVSGSGESRSERDSE